MASALSKLTQIATTYFGGGSRLYGKKSTDLSGIIRTIQSMVNDINDRNQRRRWIIFIVQR